MAHQEQSFANHAQLVPLWHFFAFPVLAVNVVIEGINLFQNPSLGAGWAVLVALALLATVYTARVMSLTAQNRIICGEERDRLRRLLPPDFAAGIAVFTPDQLIAMRFASDAELPALARRVADGEFGADRKAIKQAVQVWRADYMRV